MRIELYDLRMLFHKKAVPLCVHLDKNAKLAACRQTKVMPQTIKHYINFMKKHFYFIAAICMLFAATLQVKAYDLSYHFYIPAAQGFVSESGYAMQWHYEGSSESQIAALTADPDASSWYQAIVSLSDYDYNPIQFTLLNASTAEAATESVACEYATFGGYGLLGKKADGSHFLYFTTDEWSATYPNDYLPYNLQAHQGQDTLYVSWESNSDPGNWRVYVYDANDLTQELSYNYLYTKEGYVILSNSEPMQIVWKVVPNIYYEAQEALSVYSAPMSVLPSPKVATNIHGVLNADGTYTFSWDAAESPDVKQYWINVLDPTGKSVYSSDKYLRATSVTASIQAMYSGTYSIVIASYGEDTWNSLGEGRGTFEVVPVAAHDITVRIMLGANSGIDTSTGVKFDVEKTAGNTEEVDATQESYGWYSYTFNTTERGARVGVKNSGYYYTPMIDIYGDTCVEYNQYSGYREAECDARANDYVPHDILVSQNEDGTYTVSWLMDATQRVAYYRVYMSNSMTGEYVLQLDECPIAQAITSGALAAGFYYIQIAVFEQVPNQWGGYDIYQIGSANSYYNVEEQASHDITVRVLPQPGAGDWIALTYNADNYDYTDQVMFEKEGEGPWYSCTFNTTSPVVNIKFLTTEDYFYGGDGKLIACGENTCIEFDGEFRVADCNTTLKDYSISNVQREDLGGGKMTFSWECASTPEQFAIYLCDADESPFKVFKADGQARSFTGTVMVDSAMATVKWYVLPILQKDAYLFDLKADGAPFALEASPYIPKNINASVNSDGTWTITWDPCPEPVFAYSVYNSADGYTMWTNDLTFTTSNIPSVGTFTVRITPQMPYGEEGGTKTATFDVLPVPARDITIRVLIHPDATGSAQQMYIPDTYSYIDYVDEGNGWYSYTINSTLPAQSFQLFGSQYTVSKDTCFEYVSYLNYAPCDATPHDYRIDPASLQAVSTPGRVTFSWAPMSEKASQYTLEIQRNQGYYWSSVHYHEVNDTNYTYMVPDNQDGMEVRWVVYPSAPHHLYNQQCVGNEFTLQKSLIVLSNLQLTTSDSIHYHFTWESNTDTIQYQFQISQGYYGAPLVSTILPNKAYDYTFLSGQNAYNCRVRAVNAAGEPLSDWISYVDGEGRDYFFVKSSLRIISNLQGAIAGNLLNYTWSSSVGKVFAYLECQTAESYYITIFSDSIINGNALSVPAAMDGRYVLRLTPAIEYAPGEYTPLSEEAMCTLNYFSTPTYHISISTTTGGFLPDDPSGDYPAGFIIYLRIMNEEGYRFIGWSDGNTEWRRALIVEEAVSLIALFEPVPVYNVTFAATTGGKIKLNYSETEIDRVDTTAYEGNFFNVEAVPAEGYVFYEWSDGYDNTNLSRSIYISQDTMITAVFRPICYITIPAAVGGRVQVSGAEYDKKTKKYSCVYGTEITLKADPDEGYRFAQWSDGDENVTRTIIVTESINLAATFSSVESPLSQYTLRVLSADVELGVVSQVSGTYSEGDKITISATPNERAEFVQWSDGNTSATRVITINQDLTLTAFFAVKQITLNISAGVGGSVNAEVSGTYEYGTVITIIATPAEGYHFVQWSDGYNFPSYDITLTEDLNLTATFAQQSYRVTFLNADGSLIESDSYFYGEIPACSVTPTLEPTEEWIYTFEGWTPEITAVTGNAVYIAQYSQSHAGGTGFMNAEVTEKAQKLLINGQIYIIRAGKIYTIQGQVVK